MARSKQTLSETDRRRLAAWAAGCAEHVLPLFATAVPGDCRPWDLIARARAFADGSLGVAEAIRLRFASGVPASEVTEPAAMAAARAAGQAAATAHMGAHALGAAGYAALAAGLAARPAVGAATSEYDRAVEGEIRWQLGTLSPEARTALRLLPPLGEDRAGPLGPGMLATGKVAEVIRELQTRITSRATDSARQSDRARTNHEVHPQAALSPVHNADQ